MSVGATFLNGHPNHGWRQASVGIGDNWCQRARSREPLIKLEAEGDIGADIELVAALDEALQHRSWYSAETQHILMSMFRTAYQQGADAIGIMIDLLRSSEPTIAPLAMPLTGKPGP